MSYPADGGDGSSVDVIKVSPGTWTETATPLATSNQESADIKAALMITLNNLVDGLGGVSFVQGAVHLAQAVSDFGSNIELTLGCVAVDLSVIASGLKVAAQAFASLDHSLATMLSQLDTQMAYYTTETTLTATTVPTFTTLTIVNAPGAGGGGDNLLSSTWNHIQSWSNSASNSVSQSLGDGTLAKAAGETVGGIVIVGAFVGGILALG